MITYVTLSKRLFGGAFVKQTFTSRNSANSEHIYLSKVISDRDILSSRESVSPQNDRSPDGRNLQGSFSRRDLRTVPARFTYYYVTCHSWKCPWLPDKNHLNAKGHHKIQNRSSSDTKSERSRDAGSFLKPKLAKFHLRESGHNGYT